MLLAFARAEELYSALVIFQDYMSFLDPHDPHDRRGEEEGERYG